MLMDRIYRHQRYFYDLTRKYYLFGRDRMIRGLDLKPGARVIEVGCGTARNLIKIGHAYPHVELYGLDASAEMLRTAAASLERAGLGGRVRLVQAYAEALSPSLFGENQPFDDIIFSYSLSMIPDWKQALNAARAALSPAGCIHVVDFGDLKGLSHTAERILRGWLSLFHVAPREELLTFIEGQTKNSVAGDLHILPGRYAFIWRADVN
ncbi:MAG: class I SAM-dependent methyltransferase, partial [Steroidobacteraceae bacterium]